MVNEVILSYLKSYSAKYPLESLKKKILSAGYSEAEFNEAYSSCNKEEKNTKKESSPIKPLKTEKKPTETDFKGRGFIKIAGVSGILFLIFSTLYVVLGLSGFGGLILFLTNSVFACFFLYGFIAIGVEYNKNLVGFSSWMFIGLIILILILQIIGLLFPGLLSGFVLPDTNNLPKVQDLASTLLDFTLKILIFLAAIMLIVIVLGILFGAGLLKLKEEVKFAKIAGILMIIGSATLIIGVGIFILLLAMIFSIILLFKEGWKN